MVEKAWWQELDLAGYKDIHSIRKQKKITTDTLSSFYMFQDPSPCNDSDHSWGGASQLTKSRNSCIDMSGASSPK